MLITTNIRTREDLLDALGVAAELEHLLLCQYLFAAYTLKRSPEEGLDPVQLSKAREWGSSITLVARQEMEHLGLVMNMRSAIGGEPYFKRPNFPQKLDYFGRSELKQTLTPLDRDTVARFRFFEQPHPAPAPSYCQEPRSATDAHRVARLREIRAVERDGGFFPEPELLAHATARHREGALGAVTFSSIQDLYLQLWLGFFVVAAELGEEALFNGDPNRQIWGGPGSPYAGSMNDLNQYGVDIVGVTDLASMSFAVFEILFQGEGLFAPKSYVEHTHYCLFSSILAEMEARPGLVACRPVVQNPLTRLHPDITAPDEVNLIERPETLELAVLTNRLYELMLYMLLVLYGAENLTPEQRVALTDAAFFPLMTMFIRPLAELLTQLPAFDARPGNAGLGFELSERELRLGRAKLDPIGFIQARLDAALVEFDALSILRMHARYPAVVDRLGYVRENLARLVTDWRKGFTNVGRTEDEGTSS
jgi:hypothetical protein